MNTVVNLKHHNQFGFCKSLSTLEFWYCHYPSLDEEQTPYKDERFVHQDYQERKKQIELMNKRRAERARERRRLNHQIQQSL